jgi:hypothetical protein
VAAACSFRDGHLAGQPGGARATSPPRRPRDNLLNIESATGPHVKTWADQPQAAGWGPTHQGPGPRGVELPSQAREPGGSPRLNIQAHPSLVLRGSADAEIGFAACGATNWSSSPCLLRSSRSDGETTEKPPALDSLPLGRRGRVAHSADPVHVFLPARAGPGATGRPSDPRREAEHGSRMQRAQQYPAGRWVRHALSDSPPPPGRSAPHVVVYMMGLAMPRPKQSMTVKAG